ncbi:uncharacterized protein B0T23DRAFT_16774 [Neurospora hispaniola]|uniref:Uncharacterized protein n=1 Tax=Neurospora hispaniola TaxID=588809 RepID=A0AAJ0MV62_9PEZI|nr:hypothetical protein B0T23DRAFT_16774 [Neurospora hispaniola]
MGAMDDMGDVDKTGKVLGFRLAKSPYEVLDILEQFSLFPLRAFRGLVWVLLCQSRELSPFSSQEPASFQGQRASHKRLLHPTPGQSPEPISSAVDMYAERGGGIFRGF